MPRPRGFRIDPDAYEAIAHERGMTKSEVAKSCDPPMNVSTLSSLLVGYNNASVKTVHQLANGLRCKPEDLFPEAVGLLPFPKSGPAPTRAMESESVR